MIPTNCSAASQLSQFYRHSDSADFPWKSPSPHVWAGHKVQAFSMQAWNAWTFAPGITKKAPVLTKGRGRNLVVPPFFTVCSHKLPFKYTHPVKIIQSICEYSDKITAATPLQSTFAKSQVRCRAQRGIPYKLPLRLSPAGYSLLVSLISTCSPQRWYTEYNNVIKKCQVIIFTILTPLAFFI